jgi:hypothetical protein
MLPPRIELWVPASQACILPLYHRGRQATLPEAGYVGKILVGGKTPEKLFRNKNDTTKDRGL